MSKLSHILFIPGKTLEDYHCFDVAIAAFYAHNPNIKIDVLANSDVVHRAFRDHPDIHEIFVSASKDTLRAIRKRYDCAISFPLSEENFYAFRKLRIDTYVPAHDGISPSEALLEIVHDIT